jgi:hypothetical protein
VKAGGATKTCRARPRKTRVNMAKAGLPAPQFPGMEVSILRHHVLERSYRIRTVVKAPSGMTIRQTVASEATQGNERGAYVALDTSISQGKRDRLRGASPTATEPP